MSTDVSEMRAASIIRAMCVASAKGSWLYTRSSQAEGVTSEERVTVGDEAGQWQMGGRSIVEDREVYLLSRLAL
jgi:hypothetical protein